MGACLCMGACSITCPAIAVVVLIWFVLCARACAVEHWVWYIYRRVLHLGMVTQVDDELRVHRIESRG
jgi:hypothetical protein